ncbi:MAG: ArsR family transcriptional regulator [Bacteroidia bacterium]|nr:ArsR family transcriptional regulator [Bacteroidia bacterium]
MLKFFLNSNNTSYLRDLETEFRESTNAIRQELNRFEEARLLTSEINGNKKVFRANIKHPLFNDIHNIILKYTGIDQVIMKVQTNLGGISGAYLVGDFARGLDSKIIDLVLVGNNIDKLYLLKLIEKAEKLVKRRIRYIRISQDELSEHLKDYPEALLLWKSENNGKSNGSPKRK